MGNEILIAICLAGAMLFGCISENKVPEPVLEKYDKVSAMYQSIKNGPERASLHHCTLGNQRVYLVKGTNGKSVIIYYYDGEGEYLGSYPTPFMIDDETDIEQPVDVSEYSCEILKSNENNWCGTPW